MSESTKKWRGRVIRYAPLFLWIVLISYLSSSQGSVSRTSYIVRPFLEWLFPSASDELITIYQGYVRKIAHVVIYAGLAFWAARAYLGSSREVLRRQWAAFVMLLVLTVATLDEINQSFNSLRTGSAYDVLLDLGGATAMVLLIALVRRRFW